MMFRRREAVSEPSYPEERPHGRALPRDELLILGAQGHGFWERLTVGSVSFHQAIAESHSVLMLRV